MISRRLFSTTARSLSNVGSAPIILPEGVSISINKKYIDPVTKLRQKLEEKRKGKPPVHLTQQVSIKGPKGEVSIDIAKFVKLEEESNKLKVTVNDKTQKTQKSMWGTTRTLINNSINGVNEGHLAIIKFVGTGYRASIEEGEKGHQILNMRVGYCVPQIIKVPRDLKVQVPLPHRIIVEGVDKQKVKQLAATIRKYRPPEPYKGKGIFVDSETIKLKTRKIK